jgi:autotransporter-associated beta strand protein
MKLFSRSSVSGRLSLVYLMLALVPAAAQAQAVVSNTNDSGPGSLRAAIALVNAGSESVIDMTGIAGAISLTSPLPAIVNAVTINGPAAGGLTIDGGGAGAVLLNAGALVTLNDFVIDDGLTKTGAGAVTWNGVEQMYSGATNLSAGTIATSTDYLLSATSAVTLGAGTALLTGNTLQGIGSLAGAGTLGMQSMGIVVAGLDDTSTTFTGTVTGGTFVKSGAGTMTFQGATMDADLFVVDDSDVDLASDMEVNDILIGGSIGNGALDLGGNLLTVVGGSMAESGLVGGSITGAGSLRITGNTSFLVAGDGISSLAHTGTTTVDSNAYLLLLGNDAASGQSSLVINDNALVEVEGLNAFTALSGNGGNLSLCFCATLLVDQAVDTTFAGNITGDGGGALIKLGPGRLTLTGLNSYEGGTTVLGGTLAGNTNSLQGDIINHTIVEFIQPVNGTYAGEMSGSGALVKTGLGALTLTGANSYTGGTAIEGVINANTVGAIGNGALGIGNGALFVNASQTATSLSGSTDAGIYLGGGQSLTLDQASNTIFEGNITGGGALVKGGAGTLTLAGSSFYTGGTTVSAGRLVGTTASLKGDILNNGTVEFAQDGGIGGSYFGVISGTGAVVASGQGVLGLSETNTYTGGTTITGGGIVFAGADGVLGNGALNVESGYLDINNETVTSLTGTVDGFIQIGGQLDINQSSNTTFGGVILGNRLVKSGTGTLTLDGGLVETAEFSINGGTVVAASEYALGSFTLLRVNDADVVFGAEQELRGLEAGALATIDLNDNRLDMWSFGGATSSVMAGTLSGDGGSLGIFAGVDLTITGQATYTGSTTLGLDGRLNLAGDQRLSAQTKIGIYDSAVLSLGGDHTFAELSGFGGSVDLCAGCTLTIDQDTDSLFAGAILGGATGSFVKDGSGRLDLFGGNFWGGGTTVLGGVLGADSRSLGGDILNNAEVEFFEASEGIYAGDMSGTGALSKAGLGMLTLTGTNTYTGGTTVLSGRLAGDTASLQGDIANDAEVEFIQTGDGTYAGDMSGGGGLIKSGGGTLTLTGANTYTGGTAVAAGRLVGDAASLQGVILNFGTVEFDQEGFGQFDGPIYGTGAVVKSGGGTVYMTGINNYLGGTFITEGALIGDASSLMRDIQNDATLAFLQEDTGFFEGNVSGTGLVAKLGEGTLYMLSGVNTYTGGTIVGQGRLVGDTLTLQGIIANNATVEFAQYFDGTYDGFMVGIGSLVKSGTGVLELTGANNYFGGTTVFDGTLRGTTTSVQGDIVNYATVSFVDAGAATYDDLMTGTGVLAMDGAGTLTLASANTYTGGTSVNAGTLRLGVDDAIGTGAALVTGTLDLAGFDATIAGLNGNGKVTLGAGTINVGWNGSSSAFAGVVSGSGTLVKSGGGTLMLTGANTYTGGTFVTGGTLAGAARALNGSIVNNATVRFVEGGDGLFDGTISGGGQVVITGGGTVTFDGDNSYSGGTTIQGGTLRVASDAALGAASGALTFLDGTLAFSDEFESGRDILLEGDGTFALGSDDARLTGTISGSGALTKTGAGMLVLGGANSYSGGTSVLGGILSGDTTSLQGDIDNDALVFFDQAGTGTFEGVISGSGSVAMIGTGTLILNGAHTYTGFTEVGQGRLLLNGSLAGSVFVDQAATFGGSGSVGGDVFVAGTLVGGAFGATGQTAAGGGAGALAQPIAIAGDLAMGAQAVYQTYVGAGGAIAPLAVAGTATIAGSTLHLLEADAFGSSRRATATVLTAGAVDGGFGAVTGLSDVVDAFIMSAGNRVDVLMLNKTVDFSALGQGISASGAGAALEAVQAGASGDLAAVLREIRALESDAEVSAALDRISGSAHASFAGLTMIESAGVIDALTMRFQSRGGWWMQGLGSNLSLDSEVDPGQSSSKTKGAVVGYDRQWRRGMAGVAGGYNDSDIDASAGRDAIDGRAYRGAAYGEYRRGALVFDGIVSGAMHKVRGTRGIDFAARLSPQFGGGLIFGGVSRTAAFAYDATELAAVADAGYALELGGFRVAPSVGAQLTRISREAFGETGAESLDLRADADSVTSVAGRARLAIERRFDGAARRWVAPRASVRYTRELRDRDVPFSASLAGARFTAKGLALPDSLLAARAGVAAGFGAISFSLDYQGSVAAGHRHHLLSAGFGF